MTDVAFKSEQVKQCQAKNPDFKLADHDFFNEGEKLKISPNEKEALKTAQRLVRLTGNDLTSAETLSQNGFNSAFQIAELSEVQFVGRFGKLFDAGGKSGEKKAGDIYKNALATKTVVLLTHTAILQNNDPHYTALPFDNQSVQTQENFNRVPSYQKLFGRLDYCQCEHCRSVLSPAAYFVEAMDMTDKYIEAKGEGAVPLQNRRPDLWKLLLSCENTNKLIPSLQIVNEKLVQNLGADPEKVFEELAEKVVYPFNLPFHLPLVQMRQNLGALETTLPAIWEKLRIKPIDFDDEQRVRSWQEALNLTPGDWKIVQTSEKEPTVQDIKDCYGLNKVDDPVAALSDVKVFLKQTGLNRQQIQELIYQNLNDNEIDDGECKSFYINAGSDSPIGIEAGTQLTNLTLENLGRINGLIRLSNISKISVIDLDWALRTIGKGEPKINQTVLPYIAWMKQMLEVDKGGDINQLCAVVGTLKENGRKYEPAFFDQIYNAPHIPEHPDWNTHPQWTVPKVANAEQVDDKDIKIQNALAVALKLSQAQLLKAANWLLDITPRNGEGGEENDSSRSLKLTKGNLAVLYRISKMSELCGLSFDEIEIAALLILGNHAVKSLMGESTRDVLHALLVLTELSGWLKASDIKLYELQYMLTGESRDSSLQNRALSQEAIKNFIEQTSETMNATLFSEDYFNEKAAGLFYPNRNEAAEIVYDTLKNKQIGLEEAVVSVFPKGADSTSPNVRNVIQEVQRVAPDPLKLTEEKFVSLTHRIFAPYHAVASQCCKVEKIVSNDIGQCIDEILACPLIPSKELGQSDKEDELQKYGKFGKTGGIWKEHTSKVLSDIVVKARLGQEKTLIPPLAELLGVSSEIIEILHEKSTLEIEDFIVPDLESLQGKLVQCQRLAYIISRFHLSAKEALYLFPQLDPNQVGGIKVQAIRQMYDLKALQYRLQDTQNHLLNYFDFVQKTDDDKQHAEQLANITGWEVDDVQTLIKMLGIGKDCGTIDGIAILASWMGQKDKLGLDVKGLLTLRDFEAEPQQSFQDYQNMTNALLQGLATKTKNGPEKALSSIQESIRDVLVGLVIEKLGKTNPIHSKGDLSSYLLLDVEVGAEVETSRMREAMSAVQNYINRALSNLEAGVGVSSELEKVWQWSERYRVWQANREVFLYPENYIKPELRRVKSAQFEQLEQELQQQATPDQAAVDKIFANYLTSFARVADVDIQSMATRDYLEGEVTLKELFILGKSRKAPFEYAYMTAQFFFDSKDEAFLPVNWDFWKETSKEIQPLGGSAPTPVFAFGTWHVFWAEKRTQGASLRGEKAASPEYSGVIKYTCMDAAGNWIVAQEVEGVPNLNVSQQPCTIYPTYFSGEDALMIAYPNGTSAYGVHLLDTKMVNARIVAAYRYQSEERISHVLPTPFDEEASSGIDFQYYRKQDDKNPIRSNGNSLTVWYLDENLPEPRYRFLYGEVKKNIANAFDGENIKTKETPVFEVIDENLYMVWIDHDNALKLRRQRNDGVHEPDVTVIEPHKSTQRSHADLCLHGGSVYISWIENDEGKLARVLLEKEGMKTQGVFEFTTKNIAGRLSICGHSSGVIAAWKSSNQDTLCVQRLCHKDTDIGHKIAEGKVNALDGVESLSPDIGAVPYNKDVSSTVISFKRKGASSISVAFCIYDGGKDQNLPLASERYLEGFDQLDDRIAVQDNELYFSQHDHKKNDHNFVNVRQAIVRCFADNMKILSGRTREFDQSWESEQPASCYVLGKQVHYMRLCKEEVKADFNVACTYYKDDETVIPGVKGELLKLPEFCKEAQDIVFYEKPLTQQERKRLYEAGKKVVRRKINKFTHFGDAFKNGDKVHILNQPDWYGISHNGASYLALPTQGNKYELQVYRLNSGAAEDLHQHLMRSGTDGLLSTETQSMKERRFDDIGPQEEMVSEIYRPSDIIDLTMGPTSNYFWELFFHAPFLVAQKLQNEQLFAEARHWYEYIFNPTSCEEGDTLNQVNDRYWCFLGLRSQNMTLPQAKQQAVGGNDFDPRIFAQVYEHAYNPFDPHAIAAFRPVAYQKTMVMSYMQNLFDWGDKLFREYTVESIAEASILYMLTYNLFGKKPVNLGPMSLDDPKTYEDVGKQPIPQEMVELEQYIGGAIKVPATLMPHNYVFGNVFGVPENEQFISQIKKIEQRLHNIRHGLNIDGVRQKLALFDPRLDPMEIVQQVGSGGSLSDIRNSLSVAVPYYRFEVILEKAKEVTQSVIQLGQSLQSALEKKDAEAMALLQNVNQQNILAITTASRVGQVEEIGKQIEGLTESLNNAHDRLGHYTWLKSRGVSELENVQLYSRASSATFTALSGVASTAAVPLELIPNVVGAAVGGSKFAAPAHGLAQGFNVYANILSAISDIAGIQAGYQRREEDWDLQIKMAEHETVQIKHQVEAAQFQQKVARNEAALLQKNIEQEQKVEKFLKTKFTNQELYQWMVGRLSALYSQAFQLAYELACQAEAAWQFELGTQRSMVQPNHWDNLHQGLLAGEALLLNLQQMQSGYLKEERRLEITKTVSLRQIAPQALQDLMEKGVCDFSLTEKDFDYDYPGHYFRQIKTVLISIPALIGPYQNIHATLTQVTNKTLLKPDHKGVKFLLDSKEGEVPGADVLRSDIRTNQQVALSQGVNDSGMFELSFSDPKYLPFEGTGAISDWRLEMPKAHNPIDYEALSDVIVTIKYSAKHGGESFRKSVFNELGTYSGYRTFMIAQEYPDNWRKFILSGDTLDVAIRQSQLRLNLHSYKARKADIAFVLDHGVELSDKVGINLSIDNAPAGKGNLNKTGECSIKISGAEIRPLSMWKFEFTNAKEEDRQKLQNMVMTLIYEASF
ncbi:neuraminidase-like domain-containing protein [Terasakiella sp. SH-1]|uniref:Tc toxin subunit A-related protein n=1 Tax=Terasakiella sp. SH-1 TaxID=2560057 RepID=UPI0010736E8F|nr:neuraminidase-like domain-containing protein [Terasakiella sp. SH-1]